MAGRETTDKRLVSVVVVQKDLTLFSVHPQTLRDLNS